ncbi:MAG: hypothetical protein N4A46_04555 [Schleiferiaceae bacterium]|jgi:hypothetical protein|nr:hypothetical protein [Schleiferiaceae bacterium]
METKETVHISDLHFDHKLWINELKFVEMQMNIFEERLGEVVAINTDTMARAKVEAFQNQIIRQKEVIDEIKHKIRLREQDISSLDNQDTVKEGGVLFNDHESEIDEMNTFIRLYEKMRDEFKSFVSEVS